MGIVQRMLFFVICGLLLSCSSFFWGTAALGDGKKGKNHASEQPLEYVQNCGGCHFTYPAELLPADAWKNIMKHTDNHFSQVIPIDARASLVVTNYLVHNAADISTTKLGKKMMRNLGATVPNRITELPYIIKKHRKLTQEVRLASVNGLQNCIACHPGAVQGDFDDDRVRIPRN